MWRMKWNERIYVDNGWNAGEVHNPNEIDVRVSHVDVPVFEVGVASSEVDATVTDCSMFFLSR